MFYYDQPINVRYYHYDDHEDHDYDKKIDT